MLEEIKLSLNRLANKKDAEMQRGYFKTGKGEYSEGDIFIGVRTPKIRKLVKEYQHAPISIPKMLLKSKIHDERVLALLMFVDRYERSDEVVQKSIVEFYLKNTRHINNWDLVDISAHKIVGAWLFERSRAPINKMTKSSSLWDRRISIISTLYFIQNNDFNDTLKFAKTFLKDNEDLIHKATGWMLREVGKRDKKIILQFLKQHYKVMPRTMLRYTIEKFPETTRKKYLQGKI